MREEEEEEGSQLDCIRMCSWSNMGEKRRRRSLSFSPPLATQTDSTLISDLSPLLWTTSCTLNMMTIGLRPVGAL